MKGQPPIQRGCPLDGGLNTDQNGFVPPLLTEKLYADGVAVCFGLLPSDLDGEDRLRISNMPAEDRVHRRRI